MPTNAPLDRPERQRTRLPEYIRKILDSPEGEVMMPSELEDGFSKFSFSSQRDTQTSADDPGSPPHSPLTYSVPFACEDGISWDPLPAAQTPCTIRKSASTSTSTISYMRSRRSSQESTHIELDNLADDVRRILDGMKDSLARYFYSSSFVAFYLPSLYLKVYLPAWSPLESSLDQVLTTLSTLLHLVERTFGAEECYDISIKLCPKLAKITEHGFAILKVWNQRDDKLAPENHRDFVPLGDKERKVVVRKTNKQLMELKTSIDEVEKLVKAFLLPYSTAKAAAAEVPKDNSK